MRLAIYAHPFDLDALQGAGGLARLRDLGYGEVALAVSYHDGRWLQPWHPQGRVRFLEDGTVHFLPSGDYGVLQPLPSSEVPAHGPSPLEALCAAAPSIGLRVRAWTVGTHNTRLGSVHPELCVENAFGDRYPYALCPAQAAVQQYLTALVRDVGAHRGLQTIELEAFGQMGWKHSSHHDKSSFQPSGLLDAALSACFCTACRAEMLAAGADPLATRAEVQALVRGCVDDGDALAPAKVPGRPEDAGGEPQWLAAVLAARARPVEAVARLVADAAPTTARAVQVHPHPWFTGSQLAASTAVAFPLDDERVITAYNEGPQQIEKLLGHDGLRAHAGSPKRLCIWPKAPQFTGDDDLRKVKALCARHGVASIAIYHLGLLPWRTIERAAKVLAA
jgi:hypothetical protein